MATTSGVLSDFASLVQSDQYIVLTTIFDNMTDDQIKGLVNAYKASTTVSMSVDRTFLTGGKFIHPDPLK
jgi:BRCT domain type II-containing protein